MRTRVEQALIYTYPTALPYFSAAKQEMVTHILRLAFFRAES
jgi:hypothetical protein